MPDYRVMVAGLNDAVLVFSAEVRVQLDSDTEPHWTSVQRWTVDNPRLAGRERSGFLDQNAGRHGWALRPRRLGNRAR